VKSPAEVVLGTRVSATVEVPMIVASVKLRVVDGVAAVEIDVAGSVRTNSLELGNAEISDKIDDTGTETTIVELVGTGMSVIADNTEVSTDVGRIVMSIMLELGWADISDKTDEIGTGTTTAVEVEVATSDVASTGADVAEASAGNEVGRAETDWRIVVIDSGTSVELGMTVMSIKLDVCVGTRMFEVSTGKVDVRRVGTSTRLGVADRMLVVDSIAVSTELDVVTATAPSDVAETLSVGGNTLKLGCEVTSIKLGVGVGASSSEVTSVGVSSTSEVAATTLVAETVVMSAVIVDSGRIGTSEEVATGTLIEEDEEGLGISEDASVALVTADEVARGTSNVVVAAMLDNALASEDAADAASPLVTTEAALLKRDCRLEICEATAPALLSGSTEVVRVGPLVVTANEVVVSAEDSEVASLEADVDGAPSSAEVDVSSCRSEEVAISTRLEEEASSVSTEVEVASGKMGDGVNSGVTKVDVASGTTNDELAVGRSVASKVLEAGPSVATTRELVVESTTTVGVVEESNEMITELDTSDSTEDEVVDSAITTTTLDVLELAVD